MKPERSTTSGHGISCKKWLYLCALHRTCEWG